MLDITDLRACVEKKEILKGLSLHINEGEVHAIMGPNGSGKSTLAQVLAGHPAYRVTQGQVLFCGKDLLKMSVSERAHQGLYLGFQYPVELPGVPYATFLKQALAAHKKANGQEPMDAPSFIRYIKLRAQAVGVSDDMLKRPVNVGFSGGEKKRLEVLQMAVLEPKLCMLDELDSGLDIDALRQLSQAVNVMRDSGRSFLLITHYDRLLQYIQPDVVHVMKDGRIIESGDKTLAQKLEEKGYADY